MKSIILGLLCLSVSALAARCWESEQYFQRTDGITMDAGNAKGVNEASHIVDPWPRHVGRRRIPANGERMVGAMQRYLGRQRGPGGVGVVTTGPSDTMSPIAPAAAPVGAALPSLR